MLINIGFAIFVLFKSKPIPPKTKNSFCFNSIFINKSFLSSGFNTIIESSRGIEMRYKKFVCF